MHLTNYEYMFPINFLVEQGKVYFYEKFMN